MPTSEEELQAKADRVDKLRSQVAAEEAKRTTREREIANDITAAQLDAEAAALETRLQAAKDAGKVSAVKDGASAPLDAARESLATAVAQQDAQAEAAKAAKSSGEGDK